MSMQRARTLGMTAEAALPPWARNPGGGDPARPLVRMRRLIHLGIAVMAVTVLRTSEVIELGPFPGWASVGVMWILAAANLVLVVKADWATEFAYWMNLAGIALGGLYSTARALSFYTLISERGRSDLWGAVAERVVLGLLITYIHIVNIYRPWDVR